MREYKQRERSVYGCSRSPCLYGVGFEDSAGHVDLTPARLSERVSDGDGVIMLCRAASQRGHSEHGGKIGSDGSSI